MKHWIRLSKEHLTETGWSYRQHLSHSVKQSNRLIKLAVQSYLHGLIPCIYKSNGPLGVYRIYKEIKKIQHVRKLFDRYDGKNTDG